MRSPRNTRSSAEPLDRIRTTENPGLALFRLRELAEKHPEAKALLPPPVNLNHYRRFAEDVIEARFEKVPGVSQSNVFGGEEDELQVIVNPEQLAARRLTIADVRRALAEQNIDVSGGDFWEGKRRWVVRTMGRFRDPKQVADTVIMRSADSPVYVRDVAEVKLGFKKPEGTVRRFGTSVIAINVQRRGGHQRARGPGGANQGGGRAERRDAQGQAARAVAGLSGNRIHQLLDCAGVGEHCRRQRAHRDRAAVVLAQLPLDGRRVRLDRRLHRRHVLDDGLDGPHAERPKPGGHCLRRRHAGR